jgi:hypothetical protein
VFVVLDVEVDGSEIFEQLLVELGWVALVVSVAVVVLEFSDHRDVTSFFEVEGGVSFTLVVHFLRQLLRLVAC